jgi:hypothetical protein
VFEDLLTGALKREDLKARLQSYIVAHNRMFRRSTQNSETAPWSL